MTRWFSSGWSGWRRSSGRCGKPAARPQTSRSPASGCRPPGRCRRRSASAGGVAAKAAAARRALPGDPARARAQIAAAGVTARDAVAQARAVTATRPCPGPRADRLRRPGAVIGTRLAWAVLVVVLLTFRWEQRLHVYSRTTGRGSTALAVADIALVVVLQLYHSRSARGRRPAPGVAADTGAAGGAGLRVPVPVRQGYVGALGGFLAGSVLLLVPGRWRWAGYAAVVASCRCCTRAPAAGPPVPAGERFRTCSSSPRSPRESA